MSNRVHVFIQTTVALFLVLALAVPSVARAANDNPGSPLILTASNNSVSDTLVGSTGGAYRFYQIHYQGANAPVLVSLNASNYGSAGSQAFGFNLYGPSGLSFAGSTVQSGSNTSTAQFTLTNPAAMDVLIQVYNYTNGMPISFTLTVFGLSGGSSAGLVARNNTSPDQALNVTTINASLGGSLVGSAAGAFHYYTLRYPGGNSSLTITMNVTPVYTGQGQAYGFNVYRANPSNGQTTLVASGVPVAQDAYSMTLSATITERSAATYLLQVLNYWPGTSISYGITATGLAGPTIVARGNTDPGHAIVLNSARPGATGTLTGNRGGAYNFYLVSYPGNQSSLNLSLTFSSLGGASPSAVGFNVYQGASLVATVNPIDDGTGVQSAVWSYQNPDPTTFGIQVFNYAQDATVSYTIYQVGSQ